MALATNWREITAKYVSGKDGSDGDTGGQSDPYATLLKGIENGDTTIRSGYYPEADIITTLRREIKGDGNVFIDGSANLNFLTIVSASSTPFLMSGVELMNVGNINVTSSGGGLKGFSIEKSIIKDSGDILINASTPQGSNRMLCLNSSIKAAVGGGGVALYRWTMVGGMLELDTTGIELRNSVFTESVMITTNDNNVTIRKTAIDDTCTIDGTLFTALTKDGDGGTIGITYVSNERFSGTITIGGLVVTLIDVFWSDDLGLNDTTKGDYSLEISPQSTLFNSSDIIGVYPLALSVDAGDPAFNPINSGVSIVNLNNVAGDFVLAAPGQGVATSTDDPLLAFKLPQKTTMKDAIRILGGFTPLNGEWVDKENYNNPANLEVRLSYELQSYDGATWLPSPVTWYQEENNMPVEVDNLNVGVGDVDVDFSTTTALTFDIFRIRITLRDNGV